MRLNRDNLHELPKLLDEVHDRFFDIETISYDGQQEKWSLKFGEDRQGPYTKTFCVLGVRDYHIEDTERIRIYDINTVEIDVESQTVRLVWNVPLALDLNVSRDFEIIV